MLGDVVDWYLVKSDEWYAIVDLVLNGKFWCMICD